MIITTLKNLGFSDKEIKVYLALIRLGPSPVRKLASGAGINRGTTYDILKSLIKLGLVSYFHQETRQYFVAEEPQKLEGLVEEKQKNLQKVKKDISQILPELSSLFKKSPDKPVAKYYEGLKGIKTILQDILNTVSAQKEKEYFVYSSSNIRKHIYQAYPSFTNDRIKNRIKVKVISIGSGGELKGLDQRKWLTKKQGAPTYILIYAHKVAMISVDSEKNPLGIMIEDEGINNTLKLIFSSQWDKL